jgi:hypothetical protein
MSQVFAKKKVNLNSTQWTAIAPPFDCNYISIKNADSTVDVVIRTDASDSNTEDVIASGAIETVSSSFNPDSLFTRFKEGSVVCYVKAASGSSLDIILTFVR